MDSGTEYSGKDIKMEIDGKMNGNSAIALEEPADLNVNSQNGETLNWDAVIGLSAPDLVCLSHLRWDFVYQRPQHLLSRCAQERRVFFIEEPVFHDGPAR